MAPMSEVGESAADSFQRLKCGQVSERRWPPTATLWTAASASAVAKFSPNRASASAGRRGSFVLNSREKHRGWEAMRQTHDSAQMRRLAGPRVLDPFE